MKLQRPILVLAVLAISALAGRAGAEVDAEPSSEEAPSPTVASIWTVRAGGSYVRWGSISQGHVQLFHLSVSARGWDLFEGELGAGHIIYGDQDGAQVTGPLVTLRGGISYSVFTSADWDFRIPVLMGYSHGIVNYGYRMGSVDMLSLVAGIDLTYKWINVRVLSIGADSLYATYDPDFALPRGGDLGYGGIVEIGVRVYTQRRWP